MQTISVDALDIPTARVPNESPNIVLVTFVTPDLEIVRVAMTKDQGIYLMAELSEATK